MSETMLSLEEFFEEMNEKGLDGTSRYQLRNEAIQNKQRSARLPRLKREKKKKAKLLVALELAIPFNPMNGQVDDKYNADHKFRPTQSATTVALMLKKHVNQNSNVKAVFAKRAGIAVDDWDTTDTTQLTTVDKKVFGKYRVPRVFTFPVVHIDIPVMTGQYGSDFAIDIERDPLSGKIIGEEPLVITANNFFKALCYEELEEYNKKLESKEIDHTEKQQKEYRQKIFSKNPTSDEHPSNWIMAVELPLNNEYMISADTNLSSITADTVKDYLVVAKRNKMINEALGKYADGSWRKYDSYFDFWEVDMACPTEGETPAEIGQGTSYEKPQEPLSDQKDCDAFYSEYIKYTDEVEDLEKMIISSVRISQYDEKVEKQLHSSLESVIDIESVYLTKKVLEDFKGFLTLVLGDTADSLLLDVEMGTSEKEDGSYEQGAANAAAKEATDGIDLNDVLDDSFDLELETVDAAMSLEQAMSTPA